MPPKPSISASFARLSVRGLQTTAPLPPPSTALPPTSGSASASASASSSSTYAAGPSSSALSHLPPLRSAVSATSTPDLPSSTNDAVRLIQSQSTSSTGRYVLARLHARTYLLHPRDVLTLPTLKPMQAPGTALSLTKILEVGSREYALRSPAADPSQARRAASASSSITAAVARGKGEEWKARRTTKYDSIPADLVSCHLTVLEHTKSPLERILKKKRRKGYKKTIEHKQGWTRLRVGDIVFGGEA